MANPFPFVAGEVLTAADMNGIGETTSFTPSFSNFTLGNGTINFATFVRVQNLVFVQLQVTLGSTSSVTGNIFFGCPVVPVEKTQNLVGTCVLFDANTTVNNVGYVSMTASGGNGVLQLLPINAASTYASMAAASSTIPFTWATSDIFIASATYRVA